MILTLLVVEVVLMLIAFGIGLSLGRRMDE